MTTHTTRTATARALAFGCTLLGLTASGAWPAAAGEGVELGAELNNLFLLRSDSDFDGTEPLYDENGQSVGAFATVLKPSLRWAINDHLRLYYEAELGLNFWSKQNPDVQDALDPSVFVMKHREVYGAGELRDGAVAFKLGYARTLDATGLFLNHWIGAGQLGFDLGDGMRLSFLFGEVPDQTYEGIDIQENNFVHDIFVAAIGWESSFGEQDKLSAGLHYLYDAHRVDQTRWLLCPTLHLELAREGWRLGLDALLQGGEQQGQVLGGGWQHHLAWAAQGHLEIDAEPLALAFNLLALSPDDAHPGNRWNHAFLASAKSRSATVMLTEDEVRDWYDNLDERMSSYSGGFFENRAGLLVADAKLALTVSERFIPTFILGAATVLKPENALDHTLVGVEVDLLLRFPLEEHLEFLALGGVLVPGAAGSALVNRIDLNAGAVQIMCEASVLMRY